MRQVVMCCAEQMSRQDERMQRPLAGYSLRERWEDSLGEKPSLQGKDLGEDLLRGGWKHAEKAQPGESAACPRAAGNGPAREEKHAVCFRDRGRSLEAGGVPGGAVCFGSHEGLWHALRALVRTYQYCA